MGKQLLVSPAGTAKKGIALLVSPAGTARKALAGFIGDGNGIARQFWPVASAPDISGMTLTLTNPITAGQTGTLRAAGAMTTDDGTVTYEIVSVSGAGVTVAKTTGIAAGEAVAVYTTYSTTADVSVTVTVQAVSSTGAASAAQTVTATVKRVVTVSTPSVSGGGTINSGSTGSISVYGSVASDGTAVTYEVSSYSGIASISPTTGIGNYGTISFKANTLSSSGTWSITVRAKSASGVYSATRSISGSIYVTPPPPPTTYMKISSVPWNMFIFAGTWSESIFNYTATPLPLNFTMDVSGHYSFFCKFGSTGLLKNTATVKKGDTLTITATKSVRAGHPVFDSVIMKLNGSTVLTWTVGGPWLTYQVSIGISAV